MAEKMTRVLVSKGSIGLDESGRNARRDYKVFQEDRDNVILEVPEDEADAVAARLQGFVEMNE